MLINALLLFDIGLFWWLNKFYDSSMHGFCFAFIKYFIVSKTLLDYANSFSRNGYNCLEEKKHNELIRNLKKNLTTLNYVKHLPILISAVT